MKRKRMGQLRKRAQLVSESLSAVLLKATTGTLSRRYSEPDSIHRVSLGYKVNPRRFPRLREFFFHPPGTWRP